MLDRLIAGLDVTAGDIAGMGVGGLLMEIPTRPQPREITATAAKPSVHVVVLAAGRSSRMGGPNKLMALFAGKPLIRQAAERALASAASGTIVVTGHQAARIREALDGLDVTVRAQSGFRLGPFRFAEGRHRGGPGGVGRGADRARRHACGLDRRSRPAYRRLQEFRRANGRPRDA